MPRTIVYDCTTCKHDIPYKDVHVRTTLITDATRKRVYHSIVTGHLCPVCAKKEATALRKKAA